MTVADTFSLTSKRMSEASPGGQRVNPFRFQHVTGVSQARLDVFGRQVIILAQNLFRRPTSPQQIDDKLHANASSSNDRFADQDFRIERNSIMPVHVFAPRSVSTASIS